MITMQLRSRSTIGLLLASAAATVAAFMLAPAALLSRPDAGSPLPDAVSRGFAEYWRSGRAEPPTLLARLIDYWFQWHALKVLISSLMLTVLILLAVALWQKYRQGAANRYAPAAITATVLALLATGVLLANIQATAVPVVALLPLLSDAPSTGKQAQALREMATASHSPVSTALLADITHYHWLMAALAAVLAIAAAVFSVSRWRQRSTPDARLAYMRTTLAIILFLTAALLLLLAASSAASALDPATTLEAVAP